MLKSPLPFFYDHPLSWKEALLSKSHLIYFFASSGFWLLTIIITWIAFYDSHISTALAIHNVNSASFLFYIALYVFFVIGITAIIGFFLSIPSVILRALLNIFLHSARSQYKRAFSLRLACRILPALMLIVVNGGFYYANVSTNPTHVYRHSSKIKKISKNYHAIGTQNPNAHYVFLVPNYLLENPTKLTHTKEKLKYKGNIYLESVAKPEIVALLTKTETKEFLNYYSPTTVNTLLQSKIPKEILTIGIDRKHYAPFLNLYSNNIIENRFFDLNKTSLLSNRVMAALKPLHLILRTNFFALFSPNWKWNNLSNSSTDVLQLYSSRLKKSDSANYNIVFLSELEESSEKSLFVGLSDFLTANDEKIYEDTLDQNLLNVINSLESANAHNILILPYATTPNIKMSQFFAYNNIQGLKSYRTVFDNLQNSFVCNNQYEQNIKKLDRFDPNFLYNNIQFSKKGLPYITEENLIYMQRFFSNQTVCYDKSDSIYLITNDPANTDSYTFHNEQQIYDSLKVIKLNGPKEKSILTQNEKLDFIELHKYEIFK